VKTKRFFFIATYRAPCSPKVEKEERANLEILQISLIAHFQVPSFLKKANKARAKAKARVTLTVKVVYPTDMVKTDRWFARLEETFRLAGTEIFLTNSKPKTNSVSFQAPSFSAKVKARVKTRERAKLTLRIACPTVTAERAHIEILQISLIAHFQVPSFLKKVNKARVKAKARVTLTVKVAYPTDMVKTDRWFARLEETFRLAGTAIFLTNSQPKTNSVPFQAPSFSAKVKARVKTRERAKLTLRIACPTVSANRSKQNVLVLFQTKAFFLVSRQTTKHLMKMGELVKDVCIVNLLMKK